MNTEQHLTIEFRRWLTVHQKETLHSLPDIANDYLAEMLARRARDIPFRENSKRTFFSAVEEFLEAESPAPADTIAARYTLVGERLLFLLTFAREHLLYREMFRGGMSVEAAENLAQQAYKRASNYRSIERGVKYTAEHFNDVQDVLRSTLRYEVKHYFRDVYAPIALLTTPDRLTPRR